MNIKEIPVNETNAETLKHILRVREVIDIFIIELLNRANFHDRTKLVNPELEGFEIYTPKLAMSTFGSEEYKQYLKELKPFLDHHYFNNRHHPEHFENGIDDMNLVDLIEMFADWKSASERHNDGDINKSIDINKSRFKISEQLINIFKNTLKLIDE